MLVKTIADLLRLRDSISHSKCIAIDTETNFTDDYTQRFLVGISVCTSAGGNLETWYIPIGHSIDLFGDSNYKGELPDDLFYGDFTVVMHNAKFDLHMLRLCNLKIDTDNLFDSMILSHEIDENPPHGLKELAGIRLKYSEPKELKNIIAKAGKTLGWEGLPASHMAKYAEQDARMTYELFVNLWPAAKEFKQLWTTLDRPFLLALLDIESRGLRVDSRLASAQLAAVNTRLQQIQQELGFDPAKPKLLADKLFSQVPQGLGLNPASHGLSGRPTMDDAYLSSIGHPVTALVLEYRRLSKAASTYYGPYLRLSSHTGRLHPTFKQHGTLTGRLSCENPNLQQIPRENPDSVYQVKKLFIPDEDCELWEFDFSQMEFRLAALYGEETALIEEFKRGQDIHSVVAKQLSIPRHAAKTINFAIIYGAGTKKIAQQLKLPYSSAEAILNDYRTRYPGIFKIVYKSEDAANLRHEVKYWSGRKRHFKYVSEHRKAFNSIVQGGAADIFKHSVLALHQQGFDLRNLVHDSVWVNIPKDQVKEQIKRIPSIMTDWTEEKFGLKFTVDARRLN